MSEPTIDELLRGARERLAAAPFNPPGREAVLLLGHVLERAEASVLAHGEAAVASEDHRRFEELLGRRLTGEPIAYLLGEREFYGRPFTVDRRVLIPRPETEHLVEAALGQRLAEEPRILDVGTGSGAIAVTLALEMPHARIWAGDLSLPALQVLRANARRHDVADRVFPFQADLTTAVALPAFDLVVSNPPYVDEEDAPGLSIEVVDHEPHEALFAAASGRAVVERLLDAATALRPGTPVLIEIGFGQAEWLYRAVDEHKDLELLDIVRDYGGIPRTAVLRRA